MRILISLLAPLVLLGTTLGTRIAAQGFEPALFSVAIDYWAHRKGRRQTVSALRVKLPFGQW